tara:strand:+ start:7196 stop:8785 length:1590 start_codon:yes stop_codon:yes gene_type:complete
MKKHCLSEEQLQEKLSSGVNKLADCVAVTLGPRGRNVMLRAGGKPVITKDGVTVAKFFSTDDLFEDAAAEVLKEVADNTNSSAGDGTTTSTVLAREIFNEAQKYIRAGHDPLQIKKGMEKSLESIISRLNKISQPVESFEEIKNVATVSANNDEAIGNLIATAADQAGHEGVVSVVAGRTEDTKLNLVEGFKFDGGYAAQAFVTNKRKNTVEYSEAFILVTEEKITQVAQILPVLEQVAREDRPLIIVAESVEEQALAALIMNTVRGSMRVAAVKAPGFGRERKEILSDLAMAVGATFVTRGSSPKLEDLKLKHLGKAKTIEVQKNSTTIVDGNGDWELIEERIESIKSEIKQTEDMRECKRLQHRISRLQSGVAIIEVGAASEVEMVEKKHRIEDALEAVRAAQSSGIVPGGGAALVSCISFLPKNLNNSESFGREVLKKAMLAPITQISKNCGVSPDLVIDSVMRQNKRKKSSNYGYNFVTNKVVDMFEEGIIDPAKVTITALKNAVSVVSTLLTTATCIIQEQNES